MQSWKVGKVLEKLHANQVQYHWGGGWSRFHYERKMNLVNKKRIPKVAVLLLFQRFNSNEFQPAVLSCRDAVGVITTHRKKLESVIFPTVVGVAVLEIHWWTARESQSVLNATSWTQPKRPAKGKLQKSKTYDQQVNAVPLARSFSREWQLLWKRQPHPPAVVNSIARRQPTTTGNPPAATLVARCVVNFPPIPFPNHPATARWLPRVSHRRDAPPWNCAPTVVLKSEPRTQVRFPETFKHTVDCLHIPVVASVHCFHFFFAYF